MMGATVLMPANIGVSGIMLSDRTSWGGGGGGGGGVQFE